MILKILFWPSIVTCSDRNASLESADHHSWDDAFSVFAEIKYKINKTDALHNLMFNLLQTLYQYSKVLDYHAISVWT